MYKDKQLIVLMAGHGSRLYPLTLTMPKSLLSVKQMPAIYNIIVPLIKDGLKDITFVVNDENRYIIEKFMKKTFEKINVDFKYVIQKDFSGPGMALKLTKDLIRKKTILVLGDTLVPYPKDFSKSFIVGQKVPKEKSKDYCMIEVDNENKIIKLEDKPRKTSSKYAAVGLYYFHNYKLLKQILEEDILKEGEEYQLSSYFYKYMEKENIYLEETTNWQDIGTLENYMETNKKNFNCRNFNALFLDDLSVLHKKSSWEKITSEMNWYKEIIGTDFEKITPKFYENNKFDSEYGIEYYDYLTLAEYFTFYPLGDCNKEYIFRKLFETLFNIYKKNKIVSLSFRDYMKKMLIEKTKNRISKWERQDLVDIEEIIIDGKKYIGLNECLKRLEKRIIGLCNDSINYVSIVHGDPAFSNILYSPRNTIFKFIDPRGNFVIDTIYGDYRYDLAKLRHCYHGRYDEIINDLFIVEETSNKSIKLNFFKEAPNYKILDEVLKKNDISINDIELIEGLLFASMIVLHSDYKTRQLAFYVQSIKILNKQLGVA
ncbi:MAG: sugar phosphate nucleotidyltransferase [Bacilli bacterium]